MAKKILIFLFLGGAIVIAQIFILVIFGFWTEGESYSNSILIISSIIALVGDIFLSIKLFSGKASLTLWGILLALAPLVSFVVLLIIMAVRGSFFFA